MTHVHLGERIILSGCLILNDKKQLLLLYRKDHNHYETPGGKVRLSECSNKKNSTTEDLAKTAEREAYEELGTEMKLSKLKFFAKVEFIIPDGRKAIANKFLTHIISGTPKINEPELFLRLDYFTLEQLEQQPLSPDLKLLFPELKKIMKTNN